jgi:hypothetical protein
MRTDFESQKLDWSVALPFQFFWKRVQFQHVPAASFDLAQTSAPKGFPLE